MFINRSVISGRLTKDSELRTTAKGKSVLVFSLAFNTSVKQDDGTYASKANFIDCALFGKRAISIAEYLKKGTIVTVDGHLSFNEYTTKHNDKRSKLELIVDDVEFIGTKKKK